ncbi:MAG TPA: flagellar biosynthetic protein FliR [Deltaproteobacteria bacterium]|nr:MAG: flagellar biosynthetic protein FliR [Deltaproteobacteria bacterium GWA2_55_82]OGQ62880.1 MAG: flagellar biosynthetic protein FliR [Deltaproteobacteria bacterium RIFCSPLOWO2_02_FULL_55_12]OIJ72841.1 MAG: flagellar biosynthetic protein FliR [Deltaproteobacteria bacterium GWC2_55_46]HBG46120.1 flagellar biosynthetic protein FliR [Deltaproteobacteria bacterium]HCY11618.1 flagellar biosynthetic protein FliR [Deltaproteobacteria bacterium]
MDIAQYILANYSTFLFVLVRTGSILMAAPIFGAVNVPMQIKLGLTMLIAVLLTPLTPQVPLPQSAFALAASVGGEVLIGITIGLAIRFVLSGIEFAGQVAGFQMGIGMATVYDPLHGSQVTVLGKFLSILTLLIFLSVNGHLMVIMALKKSFDAIPPYGFNFSGELMDGFLAFSREIFVLAFKFSAPVVAILIFVNVALGIMARTVPQINMFVIGFAITIFVGFLMIAMSLPVFETAVTAVFDQMWQGVFNLMRVM